MDVACVCVTLDGELVVTKLSPPRAPGIVGRGSRLITAPIVCYVPAYWPRYADFSVRFRGLLVDTSLYKHMVLFSKY